MRVRKKRLSILLLTTVLGVSMGSTVYASEPVIDETNTVVVTQNYGENIPILSKYLLQDAAGNAVEIGDEVSRDDNVAALLADISDGEMNASKNGCFETETDAKAGVVKIDFDVVGKPLTAPGKDVIFVLDESGSMNMLMHSGESVGRYKALSPCLHDDHYYCIPASLGWGNQEDVFIRLADYGASAFNNWSGIPSDVLARIRADYGLSDDSLGMNKWQPWNQHYTRQENPETGEYEYLKTTDTTTDKYNSPIGSSSGCFDRMMMEKSQVSSFSEQLLGLDAGYRVAVVGYSNGATTYTDLTDSYSAVASALDHYAGADNTNYTAGLTAAQSIIANRTDTSRKPCIIFVTDGAPYPRENNGIDVASELKNNGIDIYGVGIRVGNTSSIDPIASGIDYYRDCDTVEDFAEYLDVILNKIQQPEGSTLVDEVGENYELLVDAEHPITIGNEKYTSIDALPSSVTYDAENKVFTCKLPEVQTEGMRVSFYVQLDQNVLTDAKNSGETTYDTNGKAALIYKKLLKDGDNVVLDENDTTVSMPSPKIQVNLSSFPASVVSDHMTNNDPTILGEVVTKDDEIIYTITLTNDGTLSAEDLVIRNPIPADTEFVSAEDGGVYSEDKNYITWDVSELQPGESVQVHFKVKVTADVEDNVKDIITENFVWGWGTATDYTETDPPCIGNTLENPTPVPVGSLKITNTVTGNAGDKTKDFYYTAYYIDKDGNSVQKEFTLKHGEEFVIEDIQAGSTYTVVQQDEEGYTTTFEGDTGDIVANKMSQADFVNEKNVGTPSTGYTSNLPLWSMMAIVSAAGIALLSLFRRSKIS